MWVWERTKEDSQRRRQLQWGMKSIIDLSLKGEKEREGIEAEGSAWVKAQDHGGDGGGAGVNREWLIYKRVKIWK